MMIAPLRPAEGGIGFDHRGATELAAPDDEGFIEQPALFEVLDEGGGGLVGGAAIAFEIADDIGMGVPALVVDVDEANAAFDHPSGEETGAGEVGFGGIAAVEVEGFFGLGLEIHEVGSGGLEAIGHFVAGDAGLDFGITRDSELSAVQRFDEVEGIALEGIVDSIGVGEVKDGIALVAEANAGVNGREEAAGPVGGAAADAGAGGHDHECGKVLGFAAEAVDGPGTEAGTARLSEAGVEEDLGGRVIELVGFDGANDADVVDDFGKVREGLGEFGAGLAMPRELELGAEHRGVRDE